MLKVMDKIPEQIKLVGDGTAVVTTIAAIMTYVPAAAAIGSLIWVIMRCISEWLTIKEKLAKRK